MLRYIADVGRQQIIDDDDTARLRLEQAADQRAPDKPGAADNEYRGALKNRGVHASARALRRCEWMAETPCALYQRRIRAIVSAKPSFARHPRTFSVCLGSSTTAGTSSGPHGTIGTGSVGAIPRCASTASNTSLIVFPSPVETLNSPPGASSRSTSFIISRKSDMSRKSRTASVQKQL